jgi:hypothetical protein
MTKESDKHVSPADAQGNPVTDLPKPIGDAVPAPVEPGLDRPLPPKPRHGQSGDEVGERPDKPTEAPPRDTSAPLGDAVPAPVEPGLDKPLPAKKSSPP